MMKRKLLISILFPLLMQGINASGQITEKLVKEKFSAGLNTLLNIDSKFGQVEIFNWDEPAVLIEATMKAESENKELAEETLRKLNVDIKLEGDEILVRTLVEEKISSTSRKRVKFSVDYKIYAPAWINLKLVNKYGSVFIETIDGLADINIQYGSLTLRELGRDNTKPLNQVSLAYSRGNIEKANWLRTELSYSRLSVDEARAVICVSKYSSLSADKINSLVIDARYDTYSIGALNNFAGEMRYANLKVGEIDGKLDITSNYTSVRIERILKGFESVNINNTRGGYRLGVSENSSFNISGEAVRGDIKVNGMENLNRRLENNDLSVYGSHGNENIKPDIKIVTRDGNITINLL